MSKRIDLTQFEGHTKGPWRYEMPPEEGMRIMAGEFTMVADISHLMSNMSPETDDTNPTGLDPDAVDARVILASPDLLAELKRCYEEIDTFYPPSGMDMWGEDPNHPRHEWEEEVAAGNVNTGYWHWVSNEKRYLASE